jgi:small subunit ribosomal protein S17
METAGTNQKKSLVGEVISDKMDKTVVVKMERTFRHPLLGKTMRRSKKYKVHDEQNAAKTGDLVEFYEGRPVSKTKYMYLSRVISSRSE